MTSDLVTGHAAALPAAGGSPWKKANPLPHEARVVLTGTRSREVAERSELFTEATTTVLVFPDGAVVRLATGVNRGQLLFLTNSANKREVIVQVTGQRPYTENAFYIELQFTEPAPGFWGFEFPKADSPEPHATQTDGTPAPSPPDHAGPQAPSDALPSLTPAAAEASAAPPTANELERLRQEVERLREQLSSLQKPSARTGPGMANLDVSAAHESKPTAKPPDPVGPAPAVKRAIPDMALPVPNGNASAAAPSAPEPSPEELLPEPALHFHLPAGASRQKIRWFALLGVLALTAALAYRFRHNLPWLGRLPGFADRDSRMGLTPPEKSSAARSAVPAGPVGQTSASPPPLARGNSSLAGDPSSSAKPAPSRAAAAPQADEPIEKGGAPEENDPVPANRAAGSTLNPSISRSEGPDAEIENRGSGKTAPPKLLKSVRATPPPEAVRKFMTGNVVLDAVVSPEGRVTSAKALSGHEILQRAAIETVKKYSYEPATRNGKPVAAHVQVTVQFWYEP